jgi:hypothetical protein
MEAATSTPHGSRNLCCAPKPNLGSAPQPLLRTEAQPRLRTATSAAHRSPTSAPRGSRNLGWGSMLVPGVRAPCRRDSGYGKSHGRTPGEATRSSFSGQRIFIVSRSEPRCNPSTGLTERTEEDGGDRLAHGQGSFGTGDEVTSIFVGCPSRVRPQPVSPSRLAPSPASSPLASPVTRPVSRFRAVSRSLPTAARHPVVHASSTSGIRPGLVPNPLAAPSGFTSLWAAFQRDPATVLPAAPIGCRLGSVSRPLRVSPHLVPAAPEQPSRRSRCPEPGLPA